MSRTGPREDGAFAPRRRTRVLVAVEDRPAPHKAAPTCSPHFHEAVELVGKRWTGAIVAVLLEGGVMRFSEVGQAVPDLSDRLLSERMKELERRGLVERRVVHAPPARVEYELTEMGRDLAPAIRALTAWGRRWLD